MSPGWPDNEVPKVKGIGAQSRLVGWKELQTSLWSRPFVEDCAQSLFIEPQTEAVFIRELLDPCLSIFLAWRPKALQFILVNSAVHPFASLQLAFDSARERFQMFRAADFNQAAPFLSMLI